MTYAGLEGRQSRSAGMERKRNPGKPVKNGLLAIFYYRIFCKNAHVLLQTHDAPSLALLVSLVKNGKMSN